MSASFRISRNLSASFSSSVVNAVTTSVLNPGVNIAMTFNRVTVPCIPVGHHAAGNVEKLSVSACGMFVPGSVAFRPCD